MKTRFMRYVGKLSDETFLNNKMVMSGIVLVSMLVFIVLWWIVRQNYHDRAHIVFEQEANNHTLLLQQRFDKFENLLQGGAGFITATDHLSRDTWHNYVKALHLQTNYAGIMGLGFAKKVTSQEVSSLIDKMRQEGYPSFSIKPSGARDYYSTIVYLEPMNARNRAAIGYDMFSEPVRREAMQRARDTGLPALSGPVVLKQEIDAHIQPGVLLYLPLYHPFMKTHTVLQRREALLGYVYSPFRTYELFDSIMLKSKILNYKIYDSQQHTQLYQTSDTKLKEADHYAHRTLLVGGRVLHLHFTSTPGFDSITTDYYAIRIAFIAIVVYFLLLYLVVSLLRKQLLLKHERKKAQTYLDIVGVIVIVFDKNYQVELVNIYGCKVLEYSAEELIGKNGLDLFMPQQTRSYVRATLDALVFEDIPMYQENEIITKSGQKRLIAWRNQIYIAPDGLEKIISVGEDISLMRASETKLREQELFYRTVFDSVDEGIIIIENNYIVDCNKYALEIFEIVKHEILGKNIFSLGYTFNCEGGFLLDHMYNAQQGIYLTTKCTLEHSSKDFIPKILEVHFSQFGNEKASKLTLVIRNITQKVIEDRYIKMHSKQAQMGEMISMIAHQWRQPLAIINAITTRMRMDTLLSGSSDPKQEESLKKIEEQSSYLSKTITDYRDFFLPNKPLESIRVSEMLNKVFSLLDHALKNYGVQPEMLVVHDPIVCTYQNEVIQVIITLIMNSIDAFLINNIEKRMINITIDQDESHVVLSLLDNAGGIQKEAMSKLFTPSFTTKNSDHGTGLGLYMSKIIIEEHCKGLINIISNDAKTTIVMIKLPLNNLTLNQKEDFMNTKGNNDIK